jgi:hypothetical protein
MDLDPNSVNLDPKPHSRVKNNNKMQTTCEGAFTAMKYIVKSEADIAQGRINNFFTAILVLFY